MNIKKASWNAVTFLAKPFRKKGLRVAFPALDRSYRFLHAYIHPPFAMTPFGDKLFLDKRDSLEFSTGNYEPDVLAAFMKHVSPEGISIDIGANLGWYTLILSRLMPNGKVFAIEPDPENCALIKKNINENGRKNIILIEGGAAAENGTLDLFPSGLCNDNRFYDPRDGRTKKLSVKTYRLDDVIPRTETVAFIKMDIDGFEMSALNGMRETLGRTKVFETEFAPSYLEAAGTDPENYLNTIRDLGFQIFGIDGGEMEYPPKGLCTNLLCLRV